MPTPYPKEQMHRIKYTKLTPEEIAGRLAAVTALTSASSLSEALAGRTMRIVLDGGPALTYRFTDRNRLSVAEGDGAALQAGYGALTLDRVVLARQQGGGVLRRTDRGRIEFSLTKRDGRWRIEHAVFLPM